MKNLKICRSKKLVELKRTRPLKEKGPFMNKDPR
jgi:hypothetical protein